MSKGLRAFLLAMATVVMMVLGAIFIGLREILQPFNSLPLGTVLLAVGSLSLLIGEIVILES